MRPTSLQLGWLPWNGHESARMASIVDIPRFCVLQVSIAALAKFFLQSVHKMEPTVTRLSMKENCSYKQPAYLRVNLQSGFPQPCAVTTPCASTATVLTSHFLANIKARTLSSVGTEAPGWAASLMYRAFACYRCVKVSLYLLKKRHSLSSHASVPTTPLFDSVRLFFQDVLTSSVSRYGTESRT